MWSEQAQSFSLSWTNRHKDLTQPDSVILQRDVHLLQASLHTLGTHLAVHAGPGALPMLAHSLGHCSYDPFTSSHLTQTQEVNIALDPVK